MKVTLKIVIKPSWFCHDFFMRIAQIMFYEITVLNKEVLLVAAILPILARCQRLGLSHTFIFCPILALGDAFARSAFAKYH